MDNLSLLLFFILLNALIVVFFALIVGLKEPTVLSRFVKGEITREKMVTILGIAAVAFLVLFGIATGISKNNRENPAPVVGKTNTNATLSPTPSKTETKTIPTTTQAPTPALAQYKVIPGDTHGTTRIIHVIVQSNIKKDEIIAINDNLIDDYSDGLTHLNIEYFDDEVIAVDYFQKLSQISEAEGEELFKHYMSAYTMNKTSGYNKLEFHEGDDWTTIKTY